MKLASGIILIWTGTHASIPAGFSRVTALDSKFPKAWGAEAPNVSGGSATHQHIATGTHTHTMANHVHDTTIGAGTGGVVDSGAANGQTRVSNHTHPNANSGNPTSVSVSSETPTYSAISNNPPYYEVIYIESDGSGQIPDDVLALFFGSTVPSGWFECNGSNSTPDLRGKYLRGAATAGDAGGTGGSTTNTHTLTHSHTQSHTHSNANVIASTSQQSDSTASTADIVDINHTHTVSYSANTTAANDNPSVVTTETVEPEYAKLIAIQNQSGGESLPRGVIGLWLGSLSAIPNGWSLCNGNSGTPDLQNKYVKIADSIAQIGNTGGSNTHTHINNSHGHTISHSHTGTVSGHSHTTRHDNNSRGAASSGTTHPATVANTNFVLDNATTAAQSANNEPEYLTAAYIMLTRLNQASLFLALFVDNMK